MEFGTSITPANGGDPVGLARRSEELGFDLVTFQDHPYQPRFHDTWTLLAWVAGQTERVRLAGNVLNLPLRDPALLARSAASLDLLSGGRLELALGAGGFWDAIEAMGGPRREPRAAVEATDEAIDIIRGLHHAGDPTPFRSEGTHYRVPNAQRGPLPAHHIPIWLGALGPRMLRLIGRKADGWLPSLGRVGVDGLRAGNKLIDEAAVAAGRDPADIRRLVNVTPDVPLEVLQTLEADTLILYTDDVSEMERFAREVMPVLRATNRRPTRPSWARAKRRPGIDYDGVPRSADAVEPGDIDFPRLKSTYLRGGNPGIILRPRTTAEVVEALAFARRHRTVPLGIRSGGHGVSGRSTNDGGIVLSVARLNHIEVVGDRRVRVGPGARWSDIARTLAPHGWALTSGDYGGVGVGGLTTAGGVGWFARKHGLTLDHLRSAEVVLASGQVVRVDAAHDAELFWAIRGAGANFGIVTDFEFDVDEVGDVGFGQLAVDASDPAGLLERFGAAVEAAPRELTASLIMGPPRRGAYASILAVVDSDDPETIVSLLEPLAEIAPLVDQRVVLTPYAGLMATDGNSHHDGQGEPAGRSGLIEHLTPAFTADAEELLRSGAVHFFQLRSVGGAVADVDPMATAYANRSANFSVTALGLSQRRVDAAWDRLHHHFQGTYLNFDTDRRPERLHDAWPPEHLTRLRDLKRRYDPDGVFRDNFYLGDDR
ncbi:MAG: LLM class flavin-dependent oxidoreductase [Hamadaea sp.]|uniref:LLM class flavin-dependent oxidoreductase n=1 Tax=Hamadaea sp. TaxID=2024425 RepID=UPI0018295C53|nr:LLM class flavin-dependent oxidoreductase [Hamadaea sp.]NUR69922.1 LLM class flavin-dependent oxidoreductase [Hamadaea sp.]NUT22526.1 LLM class flavin-dependent oxidoreductase [Hamadaea sp.]